MVIYHAAVRIQPFVSLWKLTTEPYMARLSFWISLLYWLCGLPERNSRYLIEKSIQDLHNLEKYYVDAEYRNSLVSAQYPSLEYFELENIFKQEQKVKEKLNLPQKSLIKYEKVRCSKHCRHNNPAHQYYYAYIWDSSSKRLKKK